MAEPRKNLSGLSADQLRLLMERAREKDQAVTPGIRRAPRDGAPLPLSFAQERLWFLDRLAPGNAAYNIPVAARLTGPLDRAALRGAFAEVTRRHETLRVTFGEVDGVPRQEIGPAAEIPLPLVDLAGLPAERRGPETLRLAGEEVRQPFDLTRGPLLRAVLFQFGQEDHTLLLNLHHIVADGWSLGVLLRELGALYPAQGPGQPSPLPELPLQYADYAVWQRDRFQGTLLESELAFWRGRLAGVPPLELPADRPRPATASFRGERRELTLNAGETRGLRELARAGEATLFMALLALFQALLLRYTGQPDLAVGSPVANRDHRETEGLIGLFVNTVVLRADLGGDPTVRELVRRVREVTLAAYAHAELPFEKLVEELEPERQPGRNPLFQALLTLQNQPLPALRIGALDLTPCDVETGTAKVDLSVNWLEEGEELRGHFEHSADLFEAATAERLRRHYTALLRAAAEAPDRRLSELAFLTPEERRQLVVDWNGAPCSRAAETLDRLIAAQAAHAPENAALVREDGSTVTYAELDRLSDRLARRLRLLGVGPDVPVGVHLERSAELVISLVAVWKAGGAHLPLDPSYPRERLAFMLEDSGAPVAITLERLAPSLPATNARTLTLDGPGPAEEIPAGSPAAAVPRALAYILYTSGSTGRPKAVGVEHESAVRHLQTVAEAWELTAEDRVLQIHSPSFDPWFEDTVAPLLRGAAVVICGSEVWEPARLLFRAAELGVTAMPLPTPLWDQWVRESAFGPQPEHRVRMATAGGEAMSGEAAGLWWRSPLSRIRLFNGYGPTEAVITLKFHEVSREAAARARAAVEIGSPYPGRTAYILDRDGRLLPPGAPGELYLGGQILGRGYFGRPGLTAERYLPDPFADAWGGGPGGRMYRTGDLARRRPDGVLEFLGRADHQVKVRGFRIELGEIDAALVRHPAVSRAVVVAWKAPSGDTRLAAFVVPVTGSDLDAARLRTHVAESLPAFMAPAVFHLVESLPLTPNGKVDRKALERQAAASAGQETAREPRAPRTPAEKLVAGVWADLLGLPAVGAEDDFFDLGGHSLLAMRVVSRLRSAHGIELPLRVLFERPTVAALAELVEEARRAAMPAPPPRKNLSGLSADRVRLLMERMRQKDQGVTPGIRRAPRAGAPLPLSFAQTRLWFLDRLEPGNTAYNIPAALRLSGKVSIPAFAAALREISRRHETLRTTFAEIAGEPAQVIHEGPGLPLAVIDLAGLPPGRREDAAFDLAREEARLAFDLERGPVARAALLRLTADDHLALFTFHHIVSDAWSTGVLARELPALYRAFAGGRPSPLPELPIQYADFVAWQRAWLQGEVLESLLAFWRHRLAGPPAPLELPADRPRQARGAFQAAAETLDLPAGLAEGIDRLGRGRGATLFMTLLAAFEVLLHRYTGREDFTVGTPVANRDRTEIEGLIGFFVNTLVLRADTSGDPGFTGLLGRVRESAVAAYSHQDLPFERLVEELLPERDLAHTPLFQVLFTVQGELLPELDLGPGLSATLVETGAVTAKFDLSLNLGAGPRGWSGELKYDAGLFDRATIQRLAGHFKTLLAGIAAAPETRVSELPLLTDEERRQALVSWNETGPARGGRPVHELFEEHAARTPDAVALVFEEASLTFRELDGRANRLANHLRRLGIGPEARVGLCAEPSLSLIPALLGILKSGGAYVPLDPQLPAERLASMLEDSGAGALVVQEDLRDRFGEVGIPVVTADGVLAGESAAAPGKAAGPENLAYVIYTSGSTGRPKGVMVEHRQLSAYAGGVLQRMELPPGSSFATVSTLAADLGNTSVFSALASGGALHVIARDRLLNAAGMADVLGGRGVDCLKIVPSHLAALLGEEGAAGILPGRLLVTGGEACPRALVQRVRELAPGCRVLNHYGPTETTVGVLTFPTWSEEDQGGAILPLGRPLAGTQGYVVDRNLQPLPAGVPGELLIGGPQVSRGYLGRPDLTAEKFVPDPFGGEGGARLYRTGDLARRRPDGAVEFLGRIDQQVKVRGYRVEPGEVESVLATLPGVRAAAVLAHPDSAGGNRLVAYIVGAVPADLDRRLPAHMVPSGFVVLPELPLTPNGKVDRRVLAGIAPDVAPAVREHVPPRNAAEEALARVWTEILGVGLVGAQDDFFALGGHSLLGIRLLSRVEDRFGVRLPVRTLFQATTLGEMAERIAEARGEGKPEPIGRAPRDGNPLPLSFAQERLWFLDLFAPGNAVYNVPSFVRLRGPLDAAALRRTLTEVTRRHESLRTTFIERGGAPLQVIAPPGEMDLPLVPCGGEEEMLRLADEEARRPFDLSRGPLFRATLLRLGDEDHALLLNIHHIVSDGWSRGVLIREVAALYDALSLGGPSPLPELPIQYADYAVWQRNRLQGETLEAELAFWRERLAGTPPLELPADRSRPPRPSFRGGLLDLEVPDEMPGRLRALCREAEVTSYMALLAAFQTLLLRYSGQTDFAVGSPVANRTRTEVEGVIGFFVNTLALRVDLSGRPTFREILRRVREVAVEAFSHEEMPFERIVEDLHPDREAGRNPVFQVLLALQSQPWPALAMGGLDVSVIEAGTRTAKVDLNLAWRETGDRLVGVLEYSSDLFDAASAARMARHAVALLRGALETPDQTLEDLPMVSPEERRQLLVEWNEAPAESLGAEVLHQRFAAQAARAPEAVAVVCDSSRLTYGELEGRANQLARYLLRLGARPGGLVGLCLERSLEMVVAILGVLKAGAAYVPLDPEYPAERLAFMIDDSQVPLLLTQQRFLEAAPAGHGARVVALDTDADRIAGEDATDPGIPISAEHPAYVIYTSGSTGRPKGVIVRHGNAARLFSATDRWFGFGPDDVWTLFHSYAFDFSVWEIWGALLYGGRLVVVPYWVSRSPEAFYELVCDERVTVLNQTPSAFRQLVWAGEERPAELALRYVIFGGEALEPASLEPWFERHGDERPRLINMYGITETTVHVTYREVHRNDVVSAVGCPIPDLGVYLLDPALHLVPVGVPGEIFVGGAGLALGYLKRPELTAERFVPNPFGEPGSRLYRSGDLARRLPDGDLEYLGRIDHQLKIRGFRIELGEIEAALARHPAVREAVVVAWEAQPGDTRLGAFVIAEAEPAPDAAVLRAHVMATLPVYMAPSAFHFLESLPLTPNGKADRKALRRMTTAAGPEEREYVAPRNALEELLVPLWEEVLGAERIGASDDFFALGGHSLLAVRLLSKVEDLFGVRLPVQALFQSATLGAMAERIAEEMAAQSGEDFLQQLSAESEEYEESSRG